MRSHDPGSDPRAAPDGPGRPNCSRLGGDGAGGGVRGRASYRPIRSAIRSPGWTVPGARWGALGEGYRGDGPSGGRRFELGSLFAADTRFYGLTTSAGTLPRTL